MVPLEFSLVGLPLLRLYFRLLMGFLLGFHGINVDDMGRTTVKDLGTLFTLENVSRREYRISGYDLVQTEDRIRIPREARLVMLCHRV